MASREFVYKVDGASLPGPLPTVEEIESAECIVNGWGYKVVGVDDNFVVKYGSRIDLREGETQRLVAQSTRVPVPRVYALFKMPQRKGTLAVRYIVMERIKGSTLKSEWPNMDQESKDIVPRSYGSCLRRCENCQVLEGIAVWANRVDEWDLRLASISIYWAV